MIHRSLFALLLVACAAPCVLGEDWTNYGGNAKRNGLTSVIGPTAADLAWQNDDDVSIIAWHPFIENGRVFVIRESGFPQNGGSANDVLVALDLATGIEIWRTTLPFGGDTTQEWIAWIGGVQGGQVYASRSSNLQPQPIRAHDAATGVFLWQSISSTEAWAHDGVVFAPDGDLIVGDRLKVVRIESTNGTTVWSTNRSCPVSGNCGAALYGNAIYVDEPAPGGNVITKLDLVAGSILYSSPIMPGLTDQNTPFVSPDGSTIYLSRTQNNPSTDFLYAFEDTGSVFMEKWHRAVRWTTSHEHGLSADGSIYTFTTDDEFVRLDPATGDINANAGVLAPLGSPNVSPKTVVDGHGNVYVSNGWASNPASNGRVWAFTSDLAQNLFTLNLDRPNAGGPALGGSGFLVVADRSAVIAYQTPLWDDLGNALAGSLGEPILEGRGSLQSQTPVTLDVLDALPSASVTLVMGLQNLSLPFRGGIFVPSPDFFLFGLPVEDDGTLRLAFDAPSGIPSGVDLFFQCWIVDPAGPEGFAASNAITVVTP